MTILPLTARPATADDVQGAAYEVCALVAPLPGTPPTWSRALLRAVLHDAVERNRGASVLDPSTGEVFYTYDGLGEVFRATAVTVDPHRPCCTRCRQWEREHANPNATACGRFVSPVWPEGSIICTRCSQPRNDHDRHGTTACGSFTTDYEPEPDDYDLQDR